MPIIDNSDEQYLQKHPLYDSLFLSPSHELNHADLGHIFICKKEWLIQVKLEKWDGNPKLH